MTRPPLPFSHPSVWLSTWFGCGLSPVAPGTVGSLAALPLAALIAWQSGPRLLFVVAVILLGVGIVTTETYARAAGIADPPEAVIDEVAGQCLTLVVVPLAPLPYLVGFVLFRFFDIAKPFPLRWLERKLPGGYGIMLDDTGAAIYAIIVYLIGSHLLGR
ncbi:MAG TPA: phosphatidylglycerophosphatase A [Stellaceae bacterium]|jgi:phosphatidylglycerophosphatase A|nr:phosphatidylglycerophosphatase A [Stellaceae bacterium]